MLRRIEGPDFPREAILTSAQHEKSKADCSGCFCSFLVAAGLGSTVGLPGALRPQQLPKNLSPNIIPKCTLFHSCQNFLFDRTIRNTEDY